MNCAHCDTPIPANSRFCLSCGADLSDPGGGPRTTQAVDDLPTRLGKALEGRYRVAKMVGRGGMGAVFLAEDLTLERPVAIKVLPPDVSDEGMVGRFEREARTAARLDHPNIIPIFAVESAAGLHFFVMKFVSGEPLDRLLAKGRLPVEQVQHYLWEAARALGHAHLRGVVHRDIKPGNIMLDHDGRVMLADFGISKAMQSATQLTGTGQVIGTPHYMSPEQAKGLKVDGRSDQYSLAVVGYQMLTGQLPFADSSIHTVIYKHLFEAPHPIREHCPEVPPFLATSVHRALAKDPEDRYPSMEEFATAVCPDRRLSSPAPTSGELEAARQSLASEVPTEITPSRSTVSWGGMRSPRKRRRSLRAAVIGLLIVGLGGTGYWAWDTGLLDRGRIADLKALIPSGPLGNSDRAPILTGGDTTLLASVTVDSGLADAGGDSTAAEAAETAPPTTPAADRVTPQPEALTPAPQRAPRRPPRRPEPVPAQPPPPQVGLLTVNADPWGTVFLNDREIGETPVVNHELPAGAYVVRIARDGCGETVDTVNIAIGGTVRLSKQLVCGT